MLTIQGLDVFTGTEPFTVTVVILSRRSSSARMPHSDSVCKQERENFAISEVIEIPESRFSA